jgi:predicted ATPase
MTTLRGGCGLTTGFRSRLAAARVWVMSAAEIARHLDDRFTLLRGAARDAPERHRTLHAVIDWSWNLLDAEGQATMLDVTRQPVAGTGCRGRPAADD